MDNILFDNHIHTNYSFDSKEKPETYVLKAIENSYQEITFTNHNDLYPANFKTAKLDWQTEYDVPAYTMEDYQNEAEEIHMLNEKYKGKLVIKHGIELGLNVECMDYFETIAKESKYDFILGSIHNPWNMQVDDIYQHDPFTVHNMYFTTMRDSVKAMIKEVDVLSHFDFILRYGPTDEYKTLDFPKFKDIIAETLEITIQNGKGLELNTKLITSTDKNYPHPIPQIMALYKDLGGEILTYGSDSHRIDQFADSNRKLTIDYAKSHGFTSLCTYKDHQPIHHKL